MSSKVWSIEYAGIRRTLTEWGIDYAVLTRRNLDVDELALSIGTANVFSEPAFFYGAEITLWRNTVRWFKGSVTAVPAHGSSDLERQRYVVSNAWWKLDRIVYQQPYLSKMLVGGAVVPIGGLSTRVVLGKDSWGNKISCDQQISKVANYALSQGAGLCAFAALPAMPEPPMIEARDITCAEAIRRMLGFTPDCVGWFDYSGAIPILNITRREFLGSVSCDLNDGNLVRGIDGINPRYDLVPAGVVLTFLTSETDAATGGTYVVENRQIAGASMGEGVIFATIELALQGTERPETPPADLALAYYVSRSALHWEGGLTLVEQECSGQMRVGNRVNLLNGRAGWATMNAVVQTTVEDLFSGTTEVGLGAPDHLAAQDFVAMMTQFRNRPAPSDYPLTQDNGSEGIPEPAEGMPGAGDPTNEFGPQPGVEDPSGNPSGGNGGNIPAIMPYVDIQVCVDGIERTARLVGFMLSETYGL